MLDYQHAGVSRLLQEYQSRSETSNVDSHLAPADRQRA